MYFTYMINAVVYDLHIVLQHNKTNFSERNQI